MQSTPPVLPPRVETDRNDNRRPQNLRFFIERPIFASVLSIVIVVVGLVSMQVLPVAQYPEI
ncbi:MAG: efflux RND transporter permease subunit, partial [Gammaproteobacteria bacterium]